MFDYQRTLKSFPAWRQRQLRIIKRYRAFEVFYYRSSLWIHHLRVAAMIEELAGTITGLLGGFDISRAWLGALVHDDHEIVTGDIPLFHKEAMTPAEKGSLKDTEVCAAEGLAKKFPKTINGYNYQQLLCAAIHKDSREARVVSYFDKLDAYCESVHEVFAGNFSATFPMTDYPLRIARLQEEYQDITPLFCRKDVPLLNIHLRADAREIKQENYLHLGRPHTPDSIRKKTDFLFYNDWRSLVAKRLGKQGLHWLTTKVEPVARVPVESIEPQPLKLALVS